MHSSDGELKILLPVVHRITFLAPNMNYLWATQLNGFQHRSTEF